MGHGIVEVYAVCTDSFNSYGNSCRSSFLVEPRAAGNLVVKREVPPTIDFSIAISAHECVAHTAPNTGGGCSSRPSNKDAEPMKTTLCAIALLLFAAGTGCQTCGPRGGILAGGCASCGESCGGACGGGPASCGSCGSQGACGCGNACGDMCGGSCQGNCGFGQGLPGHFSQGGGGMGHGYGPGALVGGALSGLHGPSAGDARISGNFDWRGHCAAKHAVAPAEPGPPTGAYTYPYYTTRGPRDFFTSDPLPLGR